jgi:CRP-like cAMP-binding protein
MSSFVDNPLNVDEDDEGASTGGPVAEKEAPAEEASDAPAEGAWSEEQSCGDFLFWPNVEEQQEKEWKAMKAEGTANWIVHPECRFTGLWDIFSMVLIVYSCITIPYRLGFGIEANASEQIVDYAVDSIFMFDCMLTFRKAIVMDSVLIVDTGVLRTQYFKGWFLLDFFSSFPFNLLLGVFFDLDNPDAARILKLIRVFRMVKILRMVRIKRLLKKFQDAMSIKNGVMISLKFALVTVMASHFIACLFFNQSTSVKEFNWALNYCVWADKDNVNDGCTLDVCRVKNCEITCGYTARENGPVFDADNMGSGVPGTGSEAYDANFLTGDECLEQCIDCSDMGQYTAAIYYALVTMTTIGYGDILPANNDERVFCTVTMLVGASIFAYAITNMCTVVHNLNPSSVYNKGRMDELTDLCNFMKVEKLTKKKLMEFFFYKIDASAACHVNEDLILLDMSESLRRQVRLFTLRRHLSVVPFLQKYTTSQHADAVRFLGALASKIVSTPYAPGDSICKQGQEASSMYILSKGDVSVTVNGEEIAQIGDGCVVNSSALFREGRNAYSATCVDNVDVYELTREDFAETVAWYTHAEDTTAGKESYADVTMRAIEKNALESGLTLTDICDFTIDSEMTPYEDPLSEAQREAARQDEMTELKKRMALQDEYIKLLTGSISGMQ